MPHQGFAIQQMAADHVYASLDAWLSCLTGSTCVEGGCNRLLDVGADSNAVAAPTP